MIRLDSGRLAIGIRTNELLTPKFARNRWSGLRSGSDAPENDSLQTIWECGIHDYPASPQQSASPRNEAISLHLAFCSESGSISWHTKTASDASTELGVDLEEVLELSFFG